MRISYVLSSIRWQLLLAYSKGLAILACLFSVRLLLLVAC